MKRNGQELLKTTSSFQVANCHEFQNLLSSSFEYIKNFPIHSHFNSIENVLTNYQIMENNC